MSVDLVSIVEAAYRARGRMRWTEPESAVAMWAALVAGRWSLVETFDTDGEVHGRGATSPT